MTPKRASDFVGDRLKEIRQRRGLTAEGLAARCAEIGAPEITRSVIANIETGRRDKAGRRRRDVTVDELLTLAYALQVPPAPLITPFDGSESLQVAADIQMDALEAADWVVGASVTDPQRQDVMPFFLLRRIRAALARAEQVRQANAKHPENAQPALANIGRQIADFVTWMTILRLTPPKLPPDIEAIVERELAEADAQPGEMP